MPKMKTRRAAAKRYSLTANGKIKVKKRGLRHILAKHSSSVKKRRGEQGYVHPADYSLVRPMIPYAK